MANRRTSSSNSPAPDGSPQEQRWSDLLVCEHLALATIADTLKLSAAQSRIYQMHGRTFYEVRPL